MTEIISSNFPAVLLKINAVLSSAFLCDKNCIIMFVAFVVNSEISIVPFRRELYAASFRVRYGNAFSVTGVWSMIERTQCTWHRVVELWCHFVGENPEAS